MSIFAVATIGDLVGGGEIISTSQNFVTINGRLAATLNSRAAPHGPSPHDVAFVIEASQLLKINGIGIARTGNLATCGDTVQGTSHVMVSG